MRRLRNLLLWISVALAAARMLPSHIGPWSGAPGSGASDVAQAGDAESPMPAPTCANAFAERRWPTVSSALRQGAVAFCPSGYSVLWSPLSRTPLLSAERLDAGRVNEARHLKRAGNFYAEPGLPPGVRAELSDYVHSGYDRGHMAPNGDMTESQQAASFSLVNIVPQDAANNRGLWAAIETAVRDLAARDGLVFVVTGPAFDGKTVASLRGRVLVPTRLWKAVYDPRIGAAAYITPNAAGWSYRVVSIATLAAETGVDPFPSLPAEQRETAAALPPPVPPHERPEQ